MEEQLLKVISEDDSDNFSYDISYEILESEVVFDIEKKIKELKEQKEELEHSIDFYTSKTDKIDILVALCSGVLTAAIDAVLKEKRIKDVFGGSSEGKDLLDFFNASGEKQANDKVLKIGNNSKTHKKATKSKTVGNTNVKDTYNSNKNLEGMINWLEERFNIPSDKLTDEFGGSRQHHLRDFAHHPSIIGLICSLLTQFTQKCYGTDTVGKFVAIPLKGVSPDGIIKSSTDGKEIRIIGRNIHEKFFFGTTIWYYHLVSDLAGSSSSPGQGMGIPGPLMSLAKELSVLPIFRKKKGDGSETNSLSIFLSKLYNGTYFAKRDENGKIIEKRKVDARTEMGMSKELKDQAKMVIVNEAIVRGFYFIRRLFSEIKEKDIHSFSELSEIDTEKILPFKNRTIVRMMTVATSSFTATNLVIGAAVSAVKSGGNPAMFAKEFVLRINFVGIGRCVVAIGADISGGIKKTKLEYQVMGINNQLIALTNAKTQYYISGTWKEIENTEIAMQQLSETVVDSFYKAQQYWNDTKDSMQSVVENFDVVRNSLTQEEKDELVDELRFI